VIPSQSGAISHIQQNNTYKQALEKTSNTIKNSDEFMRCMDQSVNMCIQTAGNQIAQTTRNTDACKDLPTQDQQDGCTYAVTLIKASESKDTGLCTALMGTNRSQCETTVQKSIALAAKDIKLCDVLATTKISSGTGVALYHGPTNYDQCVMSIMMEDTSSTTV
jgi:viroplasmin and RNaseH domain-containing protein